MAIVTPGRGPKAGSHAADQCEAGPRPVLFVAEEAGGSPGEGYVKFCQELGAAVGRLLPTVVHLGGVQTPADSHFHRHRELLRTALDRRVRRSRPRTIIYVSRSSVTPAALIRARLLKLMEGRAPLVMVALQPRPQSGFAGRFDAHLWPDLVVVSTESERQALSLIGAQAVCISGGVDLDRFRPASAEEKRALRQRWGIPLDHDVVLHVGHLMAGRNLTALLPLTGRARTTVLVVAGSQRDAQSTGLKKELTRHNIQVLEQHLPIIEDLYRLADCYVFTPTSTDHALAMPLSVLEAMACDLPVASTPFGALIERFADIPGLRLVTGGEQLLAAVDALLGSRPSNRHLAESYSWDDVARQLVGTIEGRGLTLATPA